MITINCKQHSAQWWHARLGRPTASRFCDLVTATGQPRKGQTPRSYYLDLLCERLTGQPTQTFETAAMIRGTELEPRARAWYELATGKNVAQVGFVQEDGGRWGCSPDGLIGETGGLEIKCPMPEKFMDVIESGRVPEDHFIQVQASMWITGRKQWDYVVWTDLAGLAPVIFDVPPFAALWQCFEDVLPALCDKLDEAEKRLRAEGHGLKITPDQQEKYNDDWPFPD